MYQPGEDSGVAVQKKTALENKWAASKARLHNIISCIGASDPHPCAASCILEQLDQVKKYMTSVFDEMTAILTPAEQNEFIEDFNEQEKAYNEASSKLESVERGRIIAEFPPSAKCVGEPYFPFFHSAILFDTGTKDEEKDRYIELLSKNTSARDGWKEYFGKRKDHIASAAAWAILDLKQMPVTSLLDRFRRSDFLLSFTGHERDWKLLIKHIICRCLQKEQQSLACKKLEEVIASLADFRSTRY